MEDIAYLEVILTTDFALSSVAYWARGANIGEAIQHLRANISANTSLESFYGELKYALHPLWTIGHFRILTPSDHQSLLDTPHRHTAWGIKIHERLQQHNALAFYEPRYLRDMGVLEEIVSNIRRDIAIYSGQHRAYWASVFAGNRVYMEPFIGRERVDDIRYQYDARNFRQASRLAVQAWSERRNTSMGTGLTIIEEGRIALIAAPRKMLYPIPLQEQVQLLNFLESIQGYEHLIIDFRKCLGGAINWFTRLIMGPILEDNITLYGFAFGRYGRYSNETLESINVQLVNANLSKAGELLSAEEVLNTHHLPQINTVDILDMDFAFMFETSITARHLPRFNSNPISIGNVWLLIGPGSTSAATLSAWIARESGFATLVGEHSGGSCGGPRTIAILPNSGIAIEFDTLYMTDAHGRPFEAGVIPHYFNMVGKDALATALALIGQVSETSEVVR